MGLKEALQARERAYVPYSHFKVGTAIKLKDGTFIYGANIENGSFGLTNCAERSALFSLISQGYSPKDIVEVTVVGEGKMPISPCGACRQVMYELLPNDTVIILANLEGKTKIMSKFDLLPYGFDLDEAKK